LDISLKTVPQQFQLMQGISESLAGLVGEVHLLGLSRSERLGKAAGAILLLSGQRRERD